MDINNFSLYSKNIQNEMLNTNEHEKVLELLKEFDNIFDIESAKQKLESTWNINDNVRNYPLGGECFINAEDKKNGFSISFRFDDENVIYFYKK